ncbi:CLUMA_CG012979, isoform A [Clunio marinus]|uniref:CLUMA_CG012979, isoform A n=1 Tax=Clunio marinus TaxID=568069 RepID=A0A1J1IKX2_9DIPT|nr:CLUMA_CG012979, isoform A [Clunio marinus]
MSQSGRKSLKKKNIIPSFDDVMHAQIQHAQRFIDYDEYDSTDSNSDHSETELQEIVKEEISMKNQPQAQTFEPKEKRKKIVIYPWRPIGITGGRPMDEVNK